MAVRKNMKMVNIFVKIVINVFLIACNLSRHKKLVLVNKKYSEKAKIEDLQKIDSRIRNRKTNQIIDRKP